MRYVLDSSVAVKWVLPETDFPKAIRLRDDFHNAVHELLAPDVFPVEFAHALTKAERQLRIAPPAEWVGWRAVMADCPRLHPTLPLLPRVYAVASAARSASMTAFTSPWPNGKAAHSSRRTPA
jgi:hypothetical protein